MANQRRAGTIEIKANGEIYDAVGSFSYNLGRVKREALVGSDKVHGYKETPQVPFIEGEIRDRGNLDLAAVVTAKDVTITLTLGNDKIVVLREGWFAGDGTASTEEAVIPVRWEGMDCEEIS